MYSTASSTRSIGLGLTTAMAAALLAGCATNAAAPAMVSASKAEAALASGKYDKAIDHAEAAVLAEPRNAAYRATLGASYLDSGRFAAAATSFDDAVSLGDTSARTALSLALALIADGNNRQAIEVLNGAQDIISASDLGLAYSLAGQPQRGVHVLSNALRNGENTAKVRQNLAYSFALNGQWRESRLMAAEDVPAAKVGDRMEEWAGTITASAHRARIATLLGVPGDAMDPGQASHLALGNYPNAEQLASHAAPTRQATQQAAAAPVELMPEQPQRRAIQQELPPASQFAQASRAPMQAQPNNNAQQFERAFSAPQQTTVERLTANPMRSAQEGVSRPIVQPLPTGSRPAVSSNSPAAAPATIGENSAAAQAIANTNGTHLVQLGSFSSEKNAQRAWNIYVQRYPELANHNMVMTKANVRGKDYWRVSAAGYDAGSARNMCGRVKSAGHGCFAWSQNRPLPGAVETGTRLARR